MIGFLSYYLPLYYYPQLFPSAPLVIAALGLDIAVPWAEIFWGLLLMVVEIYLLVLVNIWAVHEIAVATGVMNADNKHERGASMLGVALEEKNTEVLRYGIDPFLGMNKRLLFAINLLLRLKGWAGSKVLRYLVQRLLGRFAVREVLDFIGMPIYMVINAYSTHAILREAKVVIMGQHLIEHLSRRLSADLVAAPGAPELLFDTLQYIAVSKRDFHQNHYLLTRSLVERYGIEASPREDPLADYAARLRGADERLRQACTLLLTLGFILDGHVSFRERRRITELADAGILACSYGDVRRWCRDFIRGAGTEALLAAHIAAPDKPALVDARDRSAVALDAALGVF